jgi:hypothetical protein
VAFKSQLNAGRSVVRGAITSGNVWLILSPAPMLRRKVATTAALLEHRATKPPAYTLALFCSCSVRPMREMLPAKDHDMIKAAPADCPISLSARPPHLCKS